MDEEETRPNGASIEDDRPPLYGSTDQDVLLKQDSYDQQARYGQATVLPTVVKKTSKAEIGIVIAISAAIVVLIVVAVAMFAQGGGFGSFEKSLGEAISSIQAGFDEAGGTGGEASGSSDDEAGDEVSDASEGIAATIGDYVIGEKAVSAYIEDFRAYGDYTDDSSWAEWLDTYGYTAEDVREQVINYYAEQHLLDVAAEEHGIEVTDEEVQSQIDEVKDYYDDDAEWQEALESAGYTEDEYIESVRRELIEEQLTEQVAGDSYDEWMESYIEDKGLVINEMPEGLPYDVDIAALLAD